MLFGIVVLVLVTGTCLVVAVAPAVLLRHHRATEAHPDQAPEAFLLLGEISAANGSERPRLFVLPAAQPNGFSLAGRHETIVTLTEGVFERLHSGELRGVLAILVAMSTHQRARVATSLAALALLLGPLVLPARALIRWGFPPSRWFEVDRRAAELVGSSAVIAALRGLAFHSNSHRRLEWSSAWCLSCVPPETNTGFLRGFGKHPSIESRMSRLAALTSRGAAGSMDQSPRLPPRQA